MKKTFFGFGVFFVLLVFYGFHVFEAEEKKNITYNLINVEIKGAVLFPGDYEVSSETTINELINYAGGLTEKALIEEIDFEQTLINNNIYYIPFIKTSKEEPNHLININTATIEELMTLPGIGHTKALAIIEYRENKGYFKSKKDLILVTGIGEKTYEQLSEKITV